MTGLTDASWFPNLITGACTLLAGLGSVGLTLGVTGKRQNTERATEHLKERNREQREAVVEVIDAGKEWARKQDAAFIALATIVDLTELSRMEGIDDLRDALTRYRKALVRARLVIDDQEIASIVRHLSDHRDGVEEHVGAVMESAKLLGRADPGIWGKASGYVAAHDRALDQLEAATLARLVDTASTTPTRRQAGGLFKRVRSIGRAR